MGVFRVGFPGSNPCYKGLKCIKICLKSMENPKIHPHKNWYFFGRNNIRQVWYTGK